MVIFQGRKFLQLRRKKEETILVYHLLLPTSACLPNYKRVFAWKLREGHLELIGTLIVCNKHSLHFKYIWFNGKTKE